MITERLLAVSLLINLGLALELARMHRKLVAAKLRALLANPPCTHDGFPTFTNAEGKLERHCLKCGKRAILE